MIHAHIVGDRMQPVITMKEAMTITGGRKPLVPVQYEAACQALAECVNLDDAKIWSDRADALAAWAKIYQDDTISRQAKVLKLRAFRRMGELARELRPGGRVASLTITKTGGRLESFTPGPLSILVEHGIKRHNAAAAMRISKIESEKFEQICDRPRVPSPMHLRTMALHSSVSWNELMRFSFGIHTWRGFCRSKPAAQRVEGLTPEEAAKALPVAREIIEWLDELERHLLKRAENK